MIHVVEEAAAFFIVRFEDHISFRVNPFRDHARPRTGDLRPDDTMNWEGSGGRRTSRPPGEFHRLPHPPERAQNLRHILEAVREPELPLAPPPDRPADARSTRPECTSRAAARSPPAVHRRSPVVRVRNRKKGRRRMGLHIAERQVVVEARAAAAALLQNVSQAPLDALPHRHRLFAVARVHRAQLSAIRRSSR